MPIMNLFDNWILVPQCNLEPSVSQFRAELFFKNLKVFFLILRVASRSERTYMINMEAEDGVPTPRAGLAIS